MKLNRDAAKGGAARSQKPSMKLSRDQAKGGTSNQKPSMKLSRDAAKKQPTKAEKNQERGQGRKKLGKFFKKNKSEGGKTIETDEPDGFSIEDSTPEGSTKNPVNKAAPRDSPQKSRKPRGAAPGASQSKMFTKKAEFAAPRRAKSLPLEEPDNPFAVTDDDPFASAGDPFADVDDPFADVGDEPNFVGVDDSSSSGEESSSEGSGSFFTSSEEDGDSDSEYEDSSDDEEEDESSDDDDSEDDSSGEGKEGRVQLVVEPVVSPEDAFGEAAHAKGQMPKRKAPQGKPDEDGFCPCCGQGWPNYDRWSKYLE